MGAWVGSVTLMRHFDDNVLPTLSHHTPRLHDQPHLLQRGDTGARVAHDRRQAGGHPWPDRADSVARPSTAALPLVARCRVASGDRPGRPSAGQRHRLRARGCPPDTVAPGSAAAMRSPSVGTDQPACIAAPSNTRSRRRSTAATIRPWRRQGRGSATPHRRGRQDGQGGERDAQGHRVILCPATRPWSGQPLVPAPPTCVGQNRLASRKLTFPTDAWRNDDHAPRPNAKRAKCRRERTRRGTPPLR